MKPFKKIETENLGLVLTISRLFFILGAVGAILITVMLGSTMASLGFMSSLSLGAVYIQFIPYCFALIVTACLLAVLISAEESYRKHTLKPVQES
ncbi:hypothetical protein HWQ46_18530 [Shewanella sp. D64]|uniref:hypothetical protein n=1 Tax=unclassified Shewanella TaxID=196818 RepID=UPI0022BA689B|nr:MULTISPECIES: hypothetical protein [unclassified Shewanella]MEC4727544.1 hypothetical protein [Shewanella sp. D64]MEC4738047.1 hypothetical protein [Shewanella sp. E94]WBJ96437.1 hypothetical protein HWQ47_04750 [Shewanella sp. MTB7]